MNQRIRHLTTAAVVAALYVFLTGISALLGLDKGVIQFRLSEMLTVLPCLTSAAIPGLFLGCFLSGLSFGALPPDLIFGSLATLLGAIGTYFLRKRVKWLAPLPPILANTAIIPFVLKLAYHLDGAIPYFAITVCLGEVICCGLLGTMLLYRMPMPLLRHLK